MRAVRGLCEGATGLAGAAGSAGPCRGWAVVGRGLWVLMLVRLLVRVLVLVRRHRVSCEMFVFVVVVCCGVEWRVAASWPRVCVLGWFCFCLRS